MMGPEAQFWNWLRGQWVGMGKTLHYQRVENMAGSGSCDVEGVYKGRYFELELKACRVPASPNSQLAIDFRASQRIWHRARHAVGGNNWIAVRVGISKGQIVYLVRGTPANADQLYRGVSERELGEMAAFFGAPTGRYILEYITGGAA